MLKLANKARALTDIYAQASLVIPLSMPSSRLPPNVILNPSSIWHTSALFATALESTTLFTRLKAPGNTNVDTLAGMADSLNVFGKQTIARLQLSVDDSGSQKSANGAGSRNTSPHEGFHTPENAYDYKSGNDSHKDAFDLDMDLTPVESLAPSSRFMPGRSKKAFGQILTRRGTSQEEIHGKTQTATDLRRSVVDQQRIHRCVISPLCISY